MLVPSYFHYSVLLISSGSLLIGSMFLKMIAILGDSSLRRVEECKWKKEGKWNTQVTEHFTTNAWYWKYDNAQNLPLYEWSHNVQSQPNLSIIWVKFSFSYLMIQTAQWYHVGQVQALYSCISGSLFMYNKIDVGAFAFAFGN